MAHPTLHSGHASQYTPRDFITRHSRCAFPYGKSETRGISSWPELREGHTDRPGPRPDRQGRLRGWQGAASSIFPSITSLHPEMKHTPSEGCVPTWGARAPGRRSAPMPPNSGPLIYIPPPLPPSPNQLRPLCPVCRRLGEGERPQGTGERRSPVSCFNEPLPPRCLRRRRNGRQPCGEGIGVGGRKPPHSGKPISAGLDPRDPDLRGGVWGRGPMAVHLSNATAP
jgi:hypothetical protein